MLKKSLFVAAIVFMFAFTVSPVFAAGLDVTLVANDNMASVENSVVAQSNTGNNFADGSYGGYGGGGGDIRNGSYMQNEGENEGDVRDSSTGAGGNGGAAGIGGTVMTGNATADAYVENRVNRNLAEIETCPCDDEIVVYVGGEETDIEEILPEGHPAVPIRVIAVLNRNSAEVGNGVVAQANTGENEAIGSYGGEGGEGGDIKNKNEGDVDTSTTGAGGHGAMSSDGGYIVSGASVSRSKAINMLNTNVTRLSRMMDADTEEDIE